MITDYPYFQVLMHGHSTSPSPSTMRYWHFTILIILHIGETELQQRHGELPYRPISTNTLSTVNFISNTITLEKSFDLRSHEKSFQDIESLWTLIYYENELLETWKADLSPEEIDKRNPECRDLRTITHNQIRSISELVENQHIRKHHDTTGPRRLKRALPAAIKSPPTPRRTQRAFPLALGAVSKLVAKSALSSYFMHLAKSGLSQTDYQDVDGNVRKGMLPLGGRVLQYAFGVARTKEVAFNQKKISLLSKQFSDLSLSHDKLLKVANITELIISELNKTIKETDNRLVEIYNISTIRDKQILRSIACIKLYADSTYLIQTIKETINDFMMADTLIPKGYKNLFTPSELDDLLVPIRRNTQYELATGSRNLWDYSIFNMIKEGSNWTYRIQIPLTSLPLFTLSKLSPFPVFPTPYSGQALVVDIPDDSRVTLADNEKYFIDKLDHETCSYSGTHGICSGPTGLIDVDFGDCPISLMLHSPEQMLKRCTFKLYTGYFPRIASSMGTFLVSSIKQHDFLHHCEGGSRNHMKTQPGSTQFRLKPGCSLNTSDILLLSPERNSSLTNQQLDLDYKPMFRFHQPINLSDFSITETDPVHPETRQRIRELEHIHDNDSDLNNHLENNSALYISLLSLVILFICFSTIILYLKFSLILPTITSMRKFLLPKTRAALHRKKGNDKINYDQNKRTETRQLKQLPPPPPAEL